MSEHIEKGSGVYAIRHLASGKAYVGSAKNMHRRWSRHLVDLAAGAHHSAKLQRAWDKHGAGEFEFVVLQLVPVLNELVDVEQLWIDRFDAFLAGFNSRPKAGNCLGMKQSAETVAKRLASKSGYRHSPETIEKIRESNRISHGTDEAKAMKSLRVRAAGYSPTAEHRAAVSRATKARVVSDETRKKLSAAHSGRVVSDTTKARISLAKMNQSAETKAKISAAHKGKTLSFEHRAKLSEAMKGKTWSEERRAAARKKSGGPHGA